MRQCCDCLHLDCISLVEWVVQDSRCINYLPPSIFVIAVSYEQILRRESPVLDVNVGIGHVVYEGGLSDVGETCHDESPGVGVDRRQSREMLADFFQIRERGLQLLHQGAGSTESCSLELLAAVQTVAVLQKAHVVVGDGVGDVFSLVYVAEGQLVVISVVEHVHQVRVEGVDVIQFGEAVNNSSHLFVDRFSHVLDFSHIELPDALNFEALADLSWCFTLSFGQRYVDELFRAGDLCYLLEVVSHSKRAQYFVSFILFQFDTPK